MPDRERSSVLAHSTWVFETWLTWPSFDASSLRGWRCGENETSLRQFSGMVQTTRLALNLTVPVGTVTEAPSSVTDLVTALKA